MNWQKRILGFLPKEFLFIVSCALVALLFGVLLPSESSEIVSDGDDDAEYQEEKSTGEKIGRVFLGKRELAESGVCYSGTNLTMTFHLGKCFPPKRYCWRCDEQSCLFSPSQKEKLNKLSDIFGKDTLTDLVDKEQFIVKIVGISDETALGCSGTRNICDNDGDPDTESCWRPKRYSVSDCGSYRCISKTPEGENINATLGRGLYEGVWPGSNVSGTKMTNESLACMRAACVAKAQGWDEDDITVEGRIGGEIGLTYVVEITGKTDGLREGFSDGSGVEGIAECPEEP